MHQNDDVSGISGTRRKLLKGITATGANVVAASTVTGRSNSSSKFLGVSYDSVTHMSQDVSTFDLTREQDGITGRLNFGGYNINIGQEAPLKPIATEPNPKYELHLNREPYVEDELPLEIRFTDYGHFIAGVATRPDGMYSRLSFGMGESDHGFSRAGVEKGLLNQGKGRQPRHLETTPEVPNKGVPKNTSIRAIAQQAEVSENE